MEMTVCIGHTIKTNLNLTASPSPFLVSQSPRRHSQEVTLIKDIDEPTAFKMMMSPVARRNAQSEDETVFKTFIHAEKLEQDFSHDSPNKPGSSTIQSTAESPTVSNLIPRACLRDFLNDTGVRFLDSLSSLTRRETTGRPRDSDIVTPAKQVFIATALVPACDAYESVNVLK